MADTDNYQRIIDDNWEMTCPLNKLYSYFVMYHYIIFTFTEELAAIGKASLL